MALRKEKQLVILGSELETLLLENDKEARKEVYIIKKGNDKKNLIIDIQLLDENDCVLQKFYTVSDGSNNSISVLLNILVKYTKAKGISDKCYLDSINNKNDTSISCGQLYYLQNGDSIFIVGSEREIKSSPLIGVLNDEYSNQLNEIRGYLEKIIDDLYEDEEKDKEINVKITGVSIERYSNLKLWNLSIVDLQNDDNLFDETLKYSYLNKDFDKKVLRYIRMYLLNKELSNISEVSIDNNSFNIYFMNGNIHTLLFPSEKTKEAFVRILDEKRYKQSFLELKTLYKVRRY